MFLQSANQTVYFITIIYILVQHSKGQAGFFPPFSSALAAQFHCNTSHKDIDFALSEKDPFHVTSCLADIAMLCPNLTGHIY